MLREAVGEPHTASEHRADEHGGVTARLDDTATNTAATKIIDSLALEQDRGQMYLSFAPGL